MYVCISPSIDFGNGPPAIVYSLYQEALPHYIYLPLAT